MPLSSQLDENDGWKRVDMGSIHFSFKDKFLCGEPIPEDAKPDNVPSQRCQTCFERTRNLYNSNNIEDAYKDI